MNNPITILDYYHQSYFDKASFQGLPVNLQEFTLRLNSSGNE